MKQQPWISHPLTDILFILLPAFLSLLLVFILPGVFGNEAGLTDAGWLVLVVLIDVSHVYSTLYRTYFDPVAFQKQKSLLMGVPAAGLILGIMLYSMSALFFWRILAYLAVFHFIRQQYGFMRIYSRAEVVPAFCKKIDVVAVYTATIYPILYWHLNGPRNFNWFLEGDFFYVSVPPIILHILKGLYFLVVVLYVLKEIWLIVRTRKFNVPRNAVLAGTFLSWYVGIVYYNGDMAFTLLNVVSHGIPYMALVWIHGNKTKEKRERTTSLLRFVYHPYGIGLFLLIIFLFAYLEESLWDILVWKEHGMVLLSGLFPVIQLPADILSMMVPILALPQLTHYILDAFIWRIKKDDFHWSNEVNKLT
ncbi:MAG TPA: hypothetical protein DHW64_02335 [Chitinophagaceae bacterium]|nr:hypothetical protein [Chitinophagaceae bacterium]